MIKSLELINNSELKKDILNNNKWLYYLLVTKEHNYNLRHLKSMSELSNKNVFGYVVKTLNILDDISKENKISDDILFCIEETLKWCEVAKCGSKTKRKEWMKRGYDLKVHNIGSYQIYLEDMDKKGNEIIATLIKTHGLIGQYIKGEVNLDKNKELYSLIEKKLINKEQLRKILIILNRCIIEAISVDLYKNIEDKINQIIDNIVNNNFPIINFNDSNYIVDRIKQLRVNCIEQNYDELKKLLQSNEEIRKRIALILERLELWYFDSAFYDFHLNDLIKILLIISNYVKDSDQIEHLTFEEIMKNMYIDYNGLSTTNIYKARIIEKYLSNITFEDILNAKIKPNPHINYEIDYEDHTIILSFKYSLSATKLIEFCEVAYDTNEVYNKAVFLLYDLFEFRRDQYDRFYNEINYLNTMNASLQNKSVLLNYIVGKNVLDIGPGGGALIDLITTEKPELSVYGIDISQNVIDELTKKKYRENKKWNIIKGNALYLLDYFKKGSIDTIIYSSIIHELFSYIETEGKKFNYKTIEKALSSAYDILPIGGRIIIRDGIMAEDKNAIRLIKFKNKDDINILKRYCHDFEGRKILFESVSDDTVKMNVNDAMEFLYTYTWGEKSYSLEVKEQFGYFTPNEYMAFLGKIFKNKYKIITINHFLQDGYEEHLLDKISIYDENYDMVKLPDSTCIIVIEKI